MHMSNSNEPIPDDLLKGLPQLEDLYSDINLEKAFGLAHNGHYEEAEAILDDLDKSSGRMNPQILDLRARICAQQGRLGEAEAKWQEALKLKPGDTGYQQGLAYVRGLQKPVRRFPRLLIGICAFLFSALLLFILWSTFQQVDENSQTLRRLVALSAAGAGASTPITPSPSTPYVVVVTVVAPAVPTAAPLPLNDLSNQVVNLQKGQEQILSQLQTSSTAVLPDIQVIIDGVEVERQEQKMAIKFKNGLFSYNWLLSKEGKALLSAVAQKLEPYSKQIRLTLVGYTSMDETSDNLFDLGMMRSVVAFTYLKQNSHLPEDVFTLLPQHGQPLPYDPSSGYPQRDRTVVIWVLPSQP